MRAAVIFLAVWAGACSTEVNAIEDTKPCAEGTLDADGRPVLLGDACYDPWASSVANFMNDMSSAIEEALPHCIALAEARGMTDTWSALEDPIDKAVAACASVEGIDLPSEWGCIWEGDPCGTIALTCTTDMPPPWLDELAAAGAAVGAACCAVENEVDAMTNVLFSISSCEPSVPHVGECAGELVTSVAEMVEKSGTMCARAQLVPSTD